MTAFDGTPRTEVLANSTHVGWEEFVEAVRGAIRSVVAEEEGAELDPGDHLIDDLGLDSFAVLTLIAEVEDRLHLIAVPNDAEPTLGNLHRSLVPR